MSKANLNINLGGDLGIIKEFINDPKYMLVALAVIIVIVIVFIFIIMMFRKALETYKSK